MKRPLTLLVILGTVSGALLTVPPNAGAQASLPVATRESPAPAEPPEPPLKPLVDALVTAGAPGAALVRRDGERWRFVAAGVSDLDSGRPLRGGDEFRAGSLTKTFIATLVLQLIDAGRLGLDDPVERHLPGLLPAGRDITVRQLLGHTSGLFNYTEDPALVEALLRGEAFTQRELVAIGTSRPLLFPPGEGFSYSNTNYIVLGLILREVGDDTIIAQLHERIIKPLGLWRTSFPVYQALLTGAFTHGYVTFPAGEVVDVTTRLNPSWAWAAGALVSNTRDLAGFYRALLDGRLVSAGLLREMRTATPIAPGLGYGLGLASYVTGCGPAWGHDGLFPGYYVQALSSPDGRHQIVLMINGDPLSGAPPARLFPTFIRSLLAAFCAGRPPTSGAVPGWSFAEPLSKIPTAGLLRE